MFFLSLYLDSRGLSRDGADHLSTYGLCLSSKTFLRHHRARVSIYNCAIRTSLLQRPHAFWIDNYNKGYRRLMMNLSVGSFHRIDATAFVLVLFTEPLGSTTSNYHQTADVKATIPTKLSCDHLTAFFSRFNDFKPDESLLESSLSHHLSVYNNPLKPPGAEDASDFAAECLGT
jgi:hypothetical protein